MSDKKLLEESTIRRFQTLANIKPLNVLEEGKKKSASKGKEDKPAGGRKTASAMKPEDSEKRAAGKELEESIEEETLEEETVEEMFMGEAEGEEAGGDMGGEMGGGEEAGGEGGDDVKPEVEALVSALNGLLAKVGKGELEVDVEAGEEGGEGEEAGGEEGGEEEEEEGAVMEAKKKKEKEEMMKEAKKKKSAEKEKEEEGVYESLDLQVEDDEALAEELTRRVAARLVAEMKKAKKAKGMTEDFLGGGTKHAKGAVKKGHGPGSKSFGTKSKGR